MGARSKIWFTRPRSHTNGLQGVLVANETILVIDADPKSQKVLEVSFKKSGYRVLIVDKIVEALETVRRESPDLIIADTELPDGDGFELIEKIGEITEERIPFIFLTEERSLKKKMRGIELGADDYLTKPIYIKEVTSRVQVILQKRAKDLLSDADVEELSGRLSEIALVDLLQTIESELRSGTIELENRRTGTGVVYFREGNILDAICGKLQGEDALYRMMKWPDGRFVLRYHDNIRRADHIEKDASALIIEGMQRIDTWNDLVSKMPPLSRVYEPDYDRLPKLLKKWPAEVGRIVRLFDGYRRLIDVIDDSPLDDVSTLRIIHRLLDDDILLDLTPSDGEAAVEQAADHDELAAWLGEGERRTELAHQPENTDPRGRPVPVLGTEAGASDVISEGEEDASIENTGNLRGDAFRQADEAPAEEIAEADEAPSGVDSTGQWHIHFDEDEREHVDTEDLDREVDGSAGVDPDVALREIEEQEKRRRDLEARQLTAQREAIGQHQTLQEIPVVAREDGPDVVLDASGEEPAREEEGRELTTDELERVRREAEAEHLARMREGMDSQQPEAEVEDGESDARVPAPEKAEEGDEEEEPREITKELHRQSILDEIDARRQEEEEAARRRRAESVDEPEEEEAVEEEAVEEEAVEEEAVEEEAVEPAEEVAEEEPAEEEPAEEVAEPEEEEAAEPEEQEDVEEEAAESEEEAVEPAEEEAAEEELTRDEHPGTTSAERRAVSIEEKESIQREAGASLSQTPRPHDVVREEDLAEGEPAPAEEGVDEGHEELSGSEAFEESEPEARVGEEESSELVPLGADENEEEPEIERQLRRASESSEPEEVSEDESSERQEEEASELEEAAPAQELAPHEEPSSEEAVQGEEEEAFAEGSGEEIERGAESLFDEALEEESEGAEQEREVVEEAMAAELEEPPIVERSARDRELVHAEYDLSGRARELRGAEEAEDETAEQPEEEDATSSEAPSPDEVETAELPRAASADVDVDEASSAESDEPEEDHRAAAVAAADSEESSEAEAATSAFDYEPEEGYVYEEPQKGMNTKTVLVIVATVVCVLFFAVYWGLSDDPSEASDRDATDKPPASLEKNAVAAATTTAAATTAGLAVAEEQDAGVADAGPTGLALDYAPDAGSSQARRTGAAAIAMAGAAADMGVGAPDMGGTAVASIDDGDRRTESTDLPRGGTDPSETGASAGDTKTTSTEEPPEDEPEEKDPKPKTDTFARRLSSAERMVRRERFSSALPLLRELSEEKSKNSKVAYLRGHAALSVGKNGEALQYLERAKSLGYSGANLYLDLAAAHQLRGNRGEAKSAYESYLEKYPEGSKAEEVRKILDNQF
jgi:DNA-binding response OmpR family regulator